MSMKKDYHKLNLEAESLLEELDRSTLDSGKIKMRQIAESRLQTKAVAALSEGCAEKLLYELQVYQIELEMQNEELCDAMSAKQEALGRYTQLFDFAPMGYFVLDDSSKIMKVNLRGASLLEHERSNLIGRRFLNYLIPEHRLIFIECLEKAFETGGEQNCEILVQISKHALWLDLKVNIGITPSDCLVAMTDITERKQAEEKLKHIAHYDLLTDLPNRVLLADRLSLAMAQCQRHNRSLAVAYMDLDGFKIINDTYGHNEGDNLLITVSKRMKEALRVGDTLARIGGDEYIAIMIDLETVDDSEPVLERLLKSAIEPVTIGDALAQVSVSIGVTFYPQDDVGADRLIRHADQAMYAAKLAGKNRYCLFDKALDDEVKTQRESINDVCLALSRRELVLYYQPKVNMNISEVIGVEALIRWQHADGGLDLPIEFLPAVEGHSICLEVGEWVIDTALKQLSQWRRMGLDLPISVNISAYQLQQDNFPTRLSELLAAHPDVPPHSLELEILETSVLSNINQVSVNMNACHALGVRFALDDFGVGYSSLTHLRYLPAHLIKIDQSFVCDMLEDADDLAIVEGVIGLAKAFQREVIAEGVETISHGEALLRLGCKLAQGHGIARAMPAGDIPEWASHWKADDAWQEQVLSK